MRLGLNGLEMVFIFVNVVELFQCTYYRLILPFSSRSGLYFWSKMLCKGTNMKSDECELKDLEWSNCRLFQMVYEHFLWRGLSKILYRTSYCKAQSTSCSCESKQLYIPNSQSEWAHLRRITAQYSTSPPSHEHLASELFCCFFVLDCLVMTVNEK